jgi:Ca2+-binding RTX toxin-like protein
MAITTLTLIGTPFVDTQFDDTFVASTGALTSTAAAGIVVTYGITGVTAVGGVATQVGTYGTLVLNTASGAYTFTPNDATIEPLAADVLAPVNGFSVFSVEAGVATGAAVLSFDITQGAPASGLITETIGNDTLTGTVAINEKFAGLTGDDTYVITGVGAIIVEAANAGIDTVTSTVTYTLAANLENLTATGTGIVLTGNELANIVTTSGGNTVAGAAGNDTLISLGGADTLAGGTGDDSYTVNTANNTFAYTAATGLTVTAPTGDVVTENAGEGWDVVTASANTTLGLNAEVLILTDFAGGIGNGNAGANYILANATGTANLNTLSGGAGADVMAGYDGNDSYVVDNIGDIVIENAAQGAADEVSSSISYTLGANVENLTLTGTVAFEATGNTLANSITGNAGNNVLNGGAGADTMVGGAGNDAYFMDDAADVITEGAGAGTDLIYSTAINTTLDGAGNIENLVVWGTTGITGNGNLANNLIFGQSLNNILTDGAGTDVLVGGRGADTYNLATDATTDTIYIAAGDSTTTGYDIATGFAVNAAGVAGDNLNLDNTTIAANVLGATGAAPIGAINTYSITSGVISFQTTAVTTIAATSLVLADAIAYVQANITGGATVGFAQGADFYVFQDGGVNGNDTLVDLVGLAATATSVGTSAATVGAVWII